MSIAVAVLVTAVAIVRNAQGVTPKPDPELVKAAEEHMAAEKKAAAEQEKKKTNKKKTPKPKKSTKPSPTPAQDTRRNDYTTPINTECPK